MIKGKGVFKVGFIFALFIVFSYSNATNQGNYMPGASHTAPHHQPPHHQPKPHHQPQPHHLQPAHGYRCSVHHQGTCGTASQHVGDVCYCTVSGGHKRQGTVIKSH